MSISNIQTYIAAAQTAIGTGDWATAETKLLQAQAELIAMPSVAQQGSARHEFTQASNVVENLLKRVQGKLAASSTTGGIQRQSITYVNPDGDDTW